MITFFPILPQDQFAIDLMIFIRRTCIFIFALIALLTKNVANAENACPSKLKIFFVNGVFNSEKAARLSLKYLQKSLKPEDFAETGLQWDQSSIDIIYNQTNGPLDLFEAYQQKKLENAHDFWIWIGNIAGAPEWFQTFVAKSINKQLQSGIAFDDLGSNILKVEELVTREQRKILLVAHSQGNFFANEIINYFRYSFNIHWIDDKESVRLVSVATPASKVEGGGSYTTLESDGVIKYIPRALPGNALNTSPNPSRFDHEFVKHYLHGNGAGPQIRKQILLEATKLAQLDKNSAESATCMKWFKKGMNEAKPGLECVKACATLEVGMGTFQCPLSCKQLCSCTTN